MIRKLLLAGGFLLGLLALSLLFTRLTGYWAVYKMPTPANEPGLSVGDKVLVTKFQEPGNYRYAIYKSKAKDSIIAGLNNEISELTYIHRICGMPGDIIEMKQGVLFINHKNFDAILDLKLQYMVSKADAGKTNPEDFPENESGSAYLQGNGDTVFIFLDNKLKQKYGGLKSLTSFYNNDTSAVSGVFKWYNKNSTWSVDNFGPLVIAADSCFVLGDNRHNSLDSRYTGFVALKDITGVVFNKY